LKCDIPFYVEYSDLYVLFTLLGKRGVTSTSRNNNDVPHDYGYKKSKSGKVPKFNGDPEELWDILEDGVGDLVFYEE